jgi:CubicO group peptidase (beta-lactamase class C family)
MRRMWLGSSLALAIAVASAADDTSKLAMVETALLPAVIFEGEAPRTAGVLEQMKSFNVPGVGFALIDDGAIEWSAGYGTLSASAAGEVTSETMFQAASISKPLVSVLVLRMRDENAFDLDAPIERYLKRYQLPAGRHSESARVTLCNLLSHTAGLTPGGYRGYPRDQSLPTTIQILEGRPPANSQPAAVEMEPGAQLAYSGAGYMLIQSAIEDARPKPFAEIMANDLLRPLQMERSTFAQPLPESFAASAARGHRRNRRMVDGGWNAYPEQAAAGLWSTPSDLARFAIELRKAYLGSGKLLSQRSARELLEPHFGDEALGLVIGGQGASRYFLHGGGNEGYRCLLILHLESGDGAVYMTSSDAGDMVGDALVRTAASVYNWPNMKPRTQRRISVAASELSELAGSYVLPSGVSLRIVFSTEPSSIALRYPNGDTYPLVAVGPATFVYDQNGLELTFSKGGGKQTFTYYGQEAVRIPTSASGR